jgi:hypothetical protein
MHRHSFTGYTINNGHPKGRLHVKVLSKENYCRQRTKQSFAAAAGVVVVPTAVRI